MSQFLWGTLQLGAFALFYWAVAFSSFAMEEPNHMAAGLFGIGFAAIVTAVVYWSIEGVRYLYGRVIKLFGSPVEFKRRSIHPQGRIEKRSERFWLPGPD